MKVIRLNNVIHDLREQADSPFGRIKVDEAIQILKDNIVEKDTWIDDLIVLKEDGVYKLDLKKLIDIRNEADYLCNEARTDIYFNNLKIRDKEDNLKH